jgi:hypothetical protein
VANAMNIFKSGKEIADFKKKYPDYNKLVQKKILKALDLT